MLLFTILFHLFRNPSLHARNHRDQILSWDSGTRNLRKHLSALLVLQLQSPKHSVLGRSQRLQEPDRFPQGPTAISCEPGGTGVTCCQLPFCTRGGKELPHHPEMPKRITWGGPACPLRRCASYSI